MSDEAVVGKVLQQQEVSRVENTNNASTPEKESLDASLKSLKGQVVNARVLEISPQGKAILEIAGQLLEVNATAKMAVGQSLLVKIEAIQPNLVLDILFSDNKGLEKNLLAALRSILTSDNKLAEGFKTLELKLTNLDFQKLPEMPREVLQQLRDILSSIDVKADSKEVLAAIKNFIKMSGINLEWQLANSPEGGELPGLENNLKVLLGQLMNHVQKQVETIEAKVLQLPVAEQILEVMTTLKTNLEKALPPLLQKRFARIFATLTKNIPLNSKGEVAARQFTQQFENLQKEISLLLADKSVDGGIRNQVESQFRQMLQNLESKFILPEEGREFVNRLLLASLGKDAGQIREKVEAFQVLSSPIADRAVSPHLILPVSILNELTDVQIKQLASGNKKNKEDTVTVVMLLELETLGKVRIDTLCQEKTLFVNISVQKGEVVPLVDAMKESFAKQLEARGMSLAKLVCRLDEEKIGKFHELEGKEVVADQGLINLKV